MIYGKQIQLELPIFLVLDYPTCTTTVKQMLILISKREFMMSIYPNSFALTIFIFNTSFKCRIEELTSTRIERQLIFQSDSLLRFYSSKIYGKFRKKIAPPDSLFFYLNPVRNIPYKSSLVNHTMAKKFHLLPTV